MMPDARSTPDQPNSPDTPVFCGMNGFQLSTFTYAAPKTMTAMTIATLISTTTPLNVVDCLMPM